MARRPSAVLLAALLTQFIGYTNAFWRMPCRSRTGVARIDPLVVPGQIADHAHVIHGAGNFGIDVKATDLKNAECTSCAVTQDRSAYWTPSLHFVYPNGTTVMVPQTGGMLVYYLLNGPNWDGTGKINAFPDGFQMLAGDKTLRNFTGPVPDPLWYTWTGNQTTQFALSQKAIGFNCLNYNIAPEPSFYRHSMPSRDLIDSTCTNGVRAELMFPSCWDGKNLDSPDHKSHVAYPQYVQNGVCPTGFENKLPGLIFETIWNTWVFKGVPGQFVWSQGDPTGNGYHGDFMNGWTSIDLLQQAVDTCTNLSGLIQDCALFDIQSDYTAADCSFDMPDVVANDNIVGPRSGLPIGVPIQSGPAPATAYKVQGAVPITSSPVTNTNTASSSSSSTSAKLTTTPNAVKTLSQTATPKSTVFPTQVASTKQSSNSQLSAKTSSTPRPISTSSPVSSLQIIGTTYETMATEILEIVIVRRTTTVTIGAMSSSTAVQ